MADNLAHPYNRRRVLTIDGLPDDDLLAIFDFYVFRYQYLDYRRFGRFDMERKIELWQLLVHVCRRWRGLVFGSPCRLNLQLSYIGRSARESLDVWPAVPLLISGHLYERPAVNNVIAVLERRDRIRQIDLDCDTTTLQVENLWRAMQVPFPELAVLRLRCFYLDAPVLPDSFLGGSAPHLRFLSLTYIPFPGLPKLLLSATHLVNLHLHDIRPSGYISPEAMATCLSVLTSLESLQLEFKYPQTYPDFNSRRPFPPTRVVLPTLTNFSFKGVNEYSEEFVTRIDAPQLYRLSIMFFNDVDFKTPELNQIISRTPTLGTYDEAYVTFGGCAALVRLCPLQPELSSYDRLVEVEIFCEVPDRQRSTLAQIFTLSSRLLLTIENLYVEVYPGSPPRGWMENTNLQWLDLLLPFTAVKNLYLSDQFLPRIALALQEHTGERTTEVFPALQNVFLEEFRPSEPVQEGIAQFISARQLTNHPVAISVWHRDS